MLENDPIARSVFQIVANNSQDVSSTCIATCIKYMENIVTNPGEEKYRKIRMGNKAFQVCSQEMVFFHTRNVLSTFVFVFVNVQERVCPADGALDFFEIVGFTRVNGTNDSGMSPSLHGSHFAVSSSKYIIICIILFCLQVKMKSFYFFRQILPMSLLKYGLCRSLVCSKSKIARTLLTFAPKHP